MSGTPDPGFVKLYRKVKDHWVTTRPDWYAGWIDILLCTDWKTGEVILTRVPARKFFGSRKAWKEFIDLLRKDGMLSSVATRHLGQGRGSEQRAIVANWAMYHSSQTQTSHEQKTGNSKGTSKRNTKRASGKENIRTEETPKETANVPQYKKFKNTSLQTDQPLTTDAPPEDLKAAAEAGHCPQDIKDQEWHVWNMTRPDPETHAAWKRLYLSHRDALRLLARLKEQAKARRGTVQQWVLELARDAEENGDACAAALTTALTNPSVGNAWAYYQATYRGRKGTPSRSRAFTAGEFVRDPATLSQGKIVELYQDGSAKLEIGDFWNPDYVTRDITGWEHCDLN